MSSSCPHCWKIHVITTIAGVLSSFSVLEEVDVEVDRTVERGQQVAGAGHIGQPARPSQCRLKIIQLSCHPATNNLDYYLI